MTVQAVAEENKLQLLCNESYEAINNEDGLQALRARAWDRFIALGLPTRKTEVFRYVPMRVLFAKERDVQLSKYETIKETLDHLTDKTDPALLIALKEVYVYRNINLTGAAQRYMYVSERTAYYHVRAWFEEFSDDVFNPAHRACLQRNRGSA